MSETTIFVTKYALSGGILERQAHKIEDKGYAWYKDPDGPSYGSMVTRGDYALTREEAVKQAEAKKAKKLASLRKQIAKLEAMTFA